MPMELGLRFLLEIFRIIVLTVGTAISLIGHFLSLPSDQFSGPLIK